MTTSAAVIIGIDAYAEQPLTSAVNDAHLFAQTLTDLGLVGSDVQMLTAPSGNNGDLPTRKGILDALRPFYTGEKQVDRLFMYYAGHGLLAFGDAGRGLPRTALVPVDVRDLTADGDILIDLDSVLTRLRFSGPAEQFFFIDACRDLGYEDYPDATTALGWRAEPPGAERQQAILYAVPPLGSASSEQGGLGVMTRHLVDALHGSGIALDYSDDLRKYIVSPESVAAYVKKRVEETIEGIPLWRRKYALPRLDHREPWTGPIRELGQPQPAELTLYVHPPDAEAATRVKLTQMEVSVGEWPPNSYRQPFAVKPRRYWLEAESDAGWVEPAHRRIDAREEREATIEIQPPNAEQAIGPPPSQEPGPSEPEVRTVDVGNLYRGLVAVPPLPGTIFAEAREPQSTVELQQIDPPYQRWATSQRLERSVLPGAYRVRFRLGRDVFCESEVDAMDGTAVRVTPIIGASPLLRDLLASYWPEPTAVVSTAFGPIQAGVLPTALAIIGIKPFDAPGELAGPFDEAVPRLDPAYFGRRPVSLVLAVDGNHWPRPVDEVLARTRVTIGLAGQETGLPLDPVRAGPAVRRVGLGVIEAPGPSFTIRVQSPEIGTFAVAAAALPGRVTVVTLTLRPDGSFDLSQNLLPVPGADHDVLVPAVGYGRMLRDLQLGQRLYAGGELVERAPGSRLLTDLVEARWTDPVVGCMSYFAVRDSGLTGPDTQESIARNLYRSFGDIADTRVIHALAFPETRDRSLPNLLEAEELPLLTRSAAELTRLARERGPVGHPVAELNRQVIPGQPWFMSWQPDWNEVARPLTVTN